MVGCGSDNNNIIEPLITTALIKQAPLSIILFLQFGNVGGQLYIAAMGQTIGNGLHMRITGKPLWLIVKVHHLPLIQFDHPAIPGTYQSSIFPRFDNIQEQGIRDREVLFAMIKAIFAKWVTADSASHEYGFFKHFYIGHAF